MEEYNGIKYKYSKRTKRYVIIYNKTRILLNILKYFLKSRTDNIIIKVTDNSFEVYEFFLLEIEFILEEVKNRHIDLAMKIGGVELNRLLGFIRSVTWVAERYQKLIFKDMLKMDLVYSKMRFKPLEHQRAAFTKYEEVKHLSNLRGYLLDASAGSGKTYSSLALMESLEYDTIIIIAPRQTIDEVWIKSITESLYKIPQEYIVLDSTTDYNGEPFIIFHYEYLDKIVKNKKLIRKLKRRRPALIIDEFHNFNNIRSLRTNNLLDFVNYMDFSDIALLTGTPIKMDTKELCPLLYILDKKFPPVVDKFFSMYGTGKPYYPDMLNYRFGLYKERITRGTSGLPKITLEEYFIKIKDGEYYTIEAIKKRMEEYKDKRTLELYDNMDYYVSRFESLLNIVYIKLIKEYEDASEILDGYRKKIGTIQQHAKERKLQSIPTIILEAAEIEREIILPNLNQDERKEFKAIRAIVKYPELKALGEALGKILLGARIECYIKLAEHLNYKDLLNLTNKKGLIFSNYISVCETAKDKLINQGYTPATVYGEHIDNLTDSVKKFNDLDSDINPIIATYKSLSTGVPLTSANVVILIDTALRTYQLEQAISRAYRIGNNDPVAVFFIKLDTGNKFNITDRDLFIVNKSSLNVELITGNDPVYNIPKQRLISDEDDDELDEATGELAKDLENEITNTIVSMFNNKLSHDKILELAGFIWRKIKIV